MRSSIMSRLPTHLVQELNDGTVALIRKLRGSLMCLAFFFDMLSMSVLYNQALADGKK